VGEAFPLEIRATAVVLFCAFGAGLMVFASPAQTMNGVAAERRSLESVPRPLSRDA
jgi:hypothetical protein